MPPKREVSFRYIMDDAEYLTYLDNDDKCEIRDDESFSSEFGDRLPTEDATQRDYAFDKSYWDADSYDFTLPNEELSADEEEKLDPLKTMVPSKHVWHLRISDVLSLHFKKRGPVVYTVRYYEVSVHNFAIVANIRKVRLNNETRTWILHLDDNTGLLVCYLKFSDLTECGMERDVAHKDLEDFLNGDTSDDDVAKRHPRLPRLEDKVFACGFLKWTRLGIRFIVQQLHVVEDFNEETAYKLKQAALYRTVYHELANRWYRMCVGFDLYWMTKTQKEVTGKTIRDVVRRALAKKPGYTSYNTEWKQLCEKFAKLKF